MEIWNHFTFRDDMYPLLSDYVRKNGITYSEGDILCSVDISENDPHWETVEYLLKAENNTFQSETVFTKEEISSAEWLTIRSRWYYDYPQPENNYRNITYTTDRQCPFTDCRIGLVQKDPFRFKRTPKWGKRNFCMTNWVFDELFVSRRAKELLESSDLKGFSFSEVRNKNGSEIMDDMYQLRIPHILPSGIADTTSRIKDVFVCPVCGQRKFRSNSRGQFVFHKEAFTDAPDFTKSAEWFGGGSSACKLILVSQKAYRFITANKLDSSLVFEPIRLA